MQTYADRKLELMRRMGEVRATEARVAEASPAQRAAAGAVGYETWPTQGDRLVDSYGFQPWGRGRAGNDIPERTRNLARMDSLVAARTNPMGKAILDTYTGFCVGDTGLTVQCISDEVLPFVEQFRDDPRNAMVTGKERMFRTWFLMGEMAQEMMVGDMTGVCRRNPIAVTRVKDVDHLGGNALWPERLWIEMPGQENLGLDVIQLDDVSGLRTGEVFWWPAFQTLETDTRGVPFLMPVLDDLEAYAQVLGNLIDRTALARYLVWDVSIEGDDTDVEAYIAQRGHRMAPPSGSIEFHNKGVEWKAQTAETGSYEDTNTSKSVLTNVAAAAGLSKHWLSDPDDVNRATSMSMAEPVRRRIGSVQNEYIANQTEMYRFVVDRAVAANRLPAEVEVPKPGGGTITMPAAMTVSVTGPQVAAADAAVTATVLVSLSQSITEMVAAGLMSSEAGQVALQKGWSDYMGVPWRPELGAPDANPNDVATAVADAEQARLKAVK